MEFKVGDRVTALGNLTGFKGAGTIIRIDENSLHYTYCIRFDCHPESQIWAYTDSVRPFGIASKILITSDGTTTTARLYDGKKVTKTAEAKCNPDDKFDFSTGAKLAFDRLMEQKKPKEDKPEPVKLYCVKSYEPEWALTKGKIYEFVPGKPFPYNSMKGFAEKDYEAWKKGRYSLAACLVPLVSRPAKVGEWVLMVRDDCVGINKKGSIARVIKRIPDEVWLYDPTGKYPGGISASHSVGYYLVLDGYDGRYEEQEKPKGWSGKVVCVETHDVGFVVGTIYSVIDGALRDKDGEFRPFRSGAAFFRKFDDLNGAAYGKFIEFKGESNAK